MHTNSYICLNVFMSNATVTIEKREIGEKMTATETKICANAPTFVSTISTGLCRLFMMVQHCQLDNHPSFAYF